MAAGWLGGAFWSIASRGMDRMSEGEWQHLSDGARELARDRRDNVTLRCKDGRVAKTFELKRWLSSGLLLPYARRFQRSSLELERRGVPAPRVDGLFARDEARRHVVTYDWVEGRDLREAFRDGDEVALVGTLADFVGRLHAQGILFRTFHFGNVLVLSSGAMGLLDIVDVRFTRRGGASASRIAGNLSQLLRYPEDEAALRRHARAFATRYRAAASLDARVSAALDRADIGWLTRE